MRLILLCLFFLTHHNLTLNASDSRSDIKLLKHQKKVIQYLNGNKDINGLILYHAMGAGKTITALSYAKQQKLNIVVLLPSILKAHWTNELGKTGIDPRRVKIYGFNNKQDLERLEKTNLKNSLVIVDEIQKFVEILRNNPEKSSINLYGKLMDVGRILLLSGTPLYNDAADLSFIGNLAIGKAFFPYNPDHFKSKYMRIDTKTSLFRGYFTESKLISCFLPMFSTFLGTSLVFLSSSIWTLPAIATVTSAAIDYTNEFNPVSTTNFRRFDAKHLAQFNRKYLSYYEAKESDLVDYPETIIEQRSVPYTQAQASYFMKFIDGVLSLKEFNLILRDSDRRYSQAELIVNGSKIQNDFISVPDSGREIGNFSLNGPNGFEVANKFKAIEQEIKKSPGKILIYSSYYNNGIRLIGQYLKSKNYAFEILNDDDELEVVSQKVAQFNSGRIKILLLHPQITEGISLTGVEQIHLLEPVKNSALEKQIIARGVRYKSHAHLPKERRKVRVYIWVSEIDYGTIFWPSSAAIIRRDHWRKHYREVNENLWTGGITQLDPKYFAKNNTPDYRVNKNKMRLVGDFNSFKNLSQSHSIEKGPANELKASSEELRSSFSSPLLYLSGTHHLSTELKSVKNPDYKITVADRYGFDFNIEIPHSQNINWGFNMRASKGLVEYTLGTQTHIIPALDVDLGINSRVHFELFPYKNLSLFWKNELDLSVFAITPSMGLGLSTRQSLGFQSFINKHLGVSLECGVEGKVLKDTFLSQYKPDENSLLELAFQSDAENLSLLTSVSPYISVGLFSNYF